MTSRLPILLSATVLSIALIVNAWPRFIAGSAIAVYEDVSSDVARGDKISLGRLHEAAQAYEVARSWVDDGSFSTQLGSLKLVSARQEKTSQSRRAALAAAEAALKRGLLQSPAQPYAWVQLAQASRALRGNTPVLSNYLSVSLDLAPWEHRLVTPRMDLALGSWQALTPSLRARLPEQARRAIDTAPLAFARSTRRNFALRQVRELLADSPIHTERFNIVYLSPD